MDLNLTDKITGALIGYAVGDALGVGTEFMQRHEVKFRYPSGLRHFNEIYRDAHRSQWVPGEWTLDTDLVLLLAADLADHGDIDHSRFATSLRDFYDSSTLDIEGYLRWVVEAPGYPEAPQRTAAAVWSRIGRYDAPNEALGRALISGMYPGDYLRFTRENCLMTHPDPRAAGAAMVIARVVHDLLWESRLTDYEELEELANGVEPRIVPYLRTARQGRLADLLLDDPDSFWFARKTMGAALWALWHAGSTAEGLHAIVAEGGDADTNASLACALLAMRYGIGSIPEKEVNTLVGIEKVREIAGRLAATLSRIASGKGE